MSRDTTDFNSLSYSDEFNDNDNAMVRVNLSLQLVGTGKTVLDVGCFDGTIGKMLMDRGNTVCGLEASQSAYEKARSKGIEVRRFNLESNAWPDFGVKFDVVFAGEIIEHIFDTDMFLHNIKKLLKDDGHLVLTTPNVASLGRRFMLLLGISPHLETTARKGDAGHIRYFTRKTLTELLEKNGFHVTSFLSDVVNLDNSGRLYLSAMAKYFPELGRSLIVRAAKMAR